MAKKTLVLYFSVNQHTKQLAEVLSDKLGADLEEVHPKEAYPENYNVLVTMVKEQIENNEIPEACELEHKLEDYDVILLGTPNWWSHIAPPLLGLMKANKVEGKTVGIFATHIGGGIGGIEKAAKEAWPNNDYLESLEVYGDGGSNREKLINEWIEKTNLK